MPSQQRGSLALPQGAPLKRWGRVIFENWNVTARRKFLSTSGPDRQLWTASVGDEHFFVA